MTPRAPDPKFPAKADNLAETTLVLEKLRQIPTTLAADVLKDQRPFECSAHGWLPVREQVMRALQGDG